MVTVVIMVMLFGLFVKSVEDKIIGQDNFSKYHCNVSFTENGRTVTLEGRCKYILTKEELYKLERARYIKERKEYER